MNLEAHVCVEFVVGAFLTLWLVQYHALALMHAIKSNDRLAVSKLVATLTKQQLKSPLAMVRAHLFLTV
jgi:hypothetical protein